MADHVRVLNPKAKAALENVKVEKPRTVRRKGKMSVFQMAWRITLFMGVVQGIFAGVMIMYISRSGATASADQVESLKGWDWMIGVVGWSIWQADFYPAVVVLGLAIWGAVKDGLRSALGVFLVLPVCAYLIAGVIALGVAWFAAHSVTVKVIQAPQVEKAEVVAPSAIGFEGVK